MKLKCSIILHNMITKFWSSRKPIRKKKLETLPYLNQLLSLVLNAMKESTIWFLVTSPFLATSAMNQQDIVKFELLHWWYQYTKNIWIVYYADEQDRACTQDTLIISDDVYLYKFVLGWNYEVPSWYVISNYERPLLIGKMFF